MKIRLGIVAGLLLMLCGAAWSATEWVTFSGPEGEFSVQMPEKPQATSSTSQSPVGPIVEHFFTDTEGDTTYTVNYQDLPRIAVLFGGAATIYDNARGGLLKDALGKQTSFTDQQIGGKAGKALTYETGHGTVGKAWFLLVGERLYVIAASTPKGQPTDNLDKFLVSFKLEG